MKKTLFVLSVAFIILSASLSVKADFLVPQPADDYINDYAGVITATDKASISAMLRQVSLKTGSQVSVVTVKSADEYNPGLDPEAFAMAIFKSWRLEEKTGKAMLIFVSIKDRQVTMELGNAKQGFYDNLMRKVVKDRMLPNFKEGDYGRGIYDGVRMLSKILNNQIDFLDNLKKYTPAGGACIIVILVVIFFGFKRKKNLGAGNNQNAKKTEKIQARQKKDARDIFGGGAAGSW